MKPKYKNKTFNSNFPPNCSITAPRQPLAPEKRTSLKFRQGVRYNSFNSAAKKWEVIKPLLN
jgi:hypothetical protein